MWSTSLRRASWLFGSFSLYVQASTAGMVPDNEVLSTANPLSSDDFVWLYSVKGAVLALSQVIILIALVFGCHACDRKRRYGHKRRRRRLQRSKESISSNGQAQPIFLDATNTTMPFQSPGPPSQSGTYGAIVHNGPYVMNVPSIDNVASTPYAPSAPNVPFMTSTTFPAGVPSSQYLQKQQAFVPQAQPQDLPPAYHTVFPEKKS